MSSIDRIKNTNYDSEFSERSYIDSLEESNPTTCQGCIDFDAGIGGENQMAHMSPGGCLYDSNEFDLDLDYDTQDELELKSIDCNVNKINEFKSIAKKKTGKNNEFIVKNMGRFTVYIESLDITPEELEKRDDNERLMKYESFIADSYAITPHSLK